MGTAHYPLVSSPRRIEVFCIKRIAPAGMAEENPLQMTWGQHSEGTFLTDV